MNKTNVDLLIIAKNIEVNSTLYCGLIAVISSINSSRLRSHLSMVILVVLRIK